MRIVAKKALLDFGRKHPPAMPAMQTFARTLLAAGWRDFAEVRGAFPHADTVRTASGNSVVVFNVGGNNWRVITAIHYNRQTAFILATLTHAEYDRMRWRDNL